MVWLVLLTWLVLAYAYYALLTANERGGLNVHRRGINNCERRKPHAPQKQGAPGKAEMRTGSMYETERKRREKPWL